MLIVAEIGVNWTSYAHAVEMMQRAKAAGADAVKFQVYLKEHVEKHPRAKELLEIQLFPDTLRVLKSAADRIGIEFFATPFFPAAVDWLEQVGVTKYKIRHADQFNEKLIGKVLHTKKPFYISTDSPSALPNARSVYCVPQYPPELKDIKIAEQDWGLYEGYSNHYPGISPSLLAVARGADYIEIHVTDYDLVDSPKDWTPIDWPVSWSFEQFKQFIDLARDMEVIR